MRKVVLAFLFSVAAAAAMEFAGKWLNERVSLWMGHVDAKDPVTLRVGTALFLAGFVWMASSGARRAMDKSLLMSDRLGVLSGCAMLLSFSIPMAELAATGDVTSPTRTAMVVVFLVALLTGLVATAFEVREWFDRYRALARAGVEVPRKGFSWWLLVAWALSLVAVVVLCATPATARNQTVQLLMIVPGLFVVLGMYPLLAITNRYVRRVNTYFEQHTTHAWSEYVGEEARAEDGATAEADGELSSEPAPAA